MLFLMHYQISYLCVYVLPFLFVDCSTRVKNVMSRYILIFDIIYILAVLAYPCFWKMPYHRIAVSVSPYPYPVSVQRRPTLLLS